MISRLEFLKLLGLGAVASKVPWKWQQGTLQERLAERPLTKASVDFLESMESNTTAVDAVATAFDSYMQASVTEWAYVRWVAGRFRVTPMPGPSFSLQNENGEHLEVSQDGDHWFKIPTGATVELYTDAEEITTWSGGHGYRQRVEARTYATVSVPTTVAIDWPKGWEVEA